MAQSPPAFGGYGPQQAQSNLQGDVNNLAPLSSPSSWQASTAQTGTDIPYTPPEPSQTFFNWLLFGFILLLVITLILTREPIGRAIKKA